MGAQNRYHISKMSRFRVTGQKGDSKKGPKPRITPEKTFLGTSKWYQSIGLKILHNICLPQIFFFQHYYTFYIIDTKHMAHHLFLGNFTRIYIEWCKQVSIYVHSTKQEVMVNCICTN